MRRTANAFGGLDFVWNHVGHPGPAAIEGIDMADFELAIDLNLRSVLVTTEAAIPEMRARGGGALLYTASTSGLVGSAFSPVYSMAKFGVVGFVRSLAKRLAPDKIRVNAVCPGPIDTPMLRVFVARPDQQQPPGEAGPIDKEQLIVRRSQQVPMRRTGTPRGDRQRRAVPAVGRGLVRLGRGAAGRWRRDRLSRCFQKGGVSSCRQELLLAPPQADELARSRSGWLCRFCWPRRHGARGGGSGQAAPLLSAPPAAAPPGPPRSAEADAAAYERCMTLARDEAGSGSQAGAGMAGTAAAAIRRNIASRSR